MELHARCGSYFRVESDNSSESCSSSLEYSEGKGHIRLGNAVTESTKKGHLNYHPTGTIDIHSVHEEVPIASESNGTRVIVVSPEDSSVSYAVESKDFETGAFIRIMKDGTIHASSPSKITINAPLIDEITELVHNHGNQQIDGTCTHGACSCIFGGGSGGGINTAGASCDIAVTTTEDTVRVYDKEGNIIEEGILGEDDTACLQAGIDACPQNGKMFICPGTFTLEADKLFYLNGSGPETADNPFYYCLGVMDGKNIEICGSGVGSTIFKMAASQHYEDHPAVMIMNRAHWWEDGATMFVVSDMTIDGNRDEQEEWYYDGPGLILTGSTASNFRFQHLWLKDSFGYGIYCGNNGSGPINGLVINDIRATNCYKTAIMTDTVCGLLINNCIIEDCNSGIECVGNQPDYLTRPRDAIVISDVICRRAGITLWTVNDVTMNGCYMDCTGAPLQYGLLVHSCIRVNINGSRFINNTNYKYSTFIDANTYMEDGPCEAFFNNCDFEGSYAFRILGEAVCHVHNGRIQGYRSCIYMIGEYESPVACKLNLHGVDILALQPVGEHEEPTLLVDIAEGGEVQFNRCEASKAGYFQVAAGGKYFARDCTGAGLEGHNSRWRKEEGTYVATPASTSTITTLIDRTGAISIGTPVRYEIAGVIYYGLVMNVTTTTLTIAGPPLSDDIDDLYFGVSEMVGQADYVIPGAFAVVGENELIKTFQKSHSVWRGKPAYLVQIGHIVQALDSTDQPEVTASINSGVVGTDNTNTGLPVALVVQSTTVGISPSNYRIAYGDVIELETTAGGNGDASDLTVFLTFVSES
ncbi:MAG: right-handed parallel beta-helix repeat-containing protein [Candidatus Delongbacteria bacterium]|nr:right-handed parallel beta-helix repeat-containing protein [Candidatus Delongbacteria bacterium]